MAKRATQIQVIGCRESTRGRLRSYAQMMRRNGIPEPRERVMRCEDCPSYRPEWEYRMCAYTTCRYKKEINVFRRKYPRSEYRCAGDR